MPFAGLQEFLRPAVIQALGNAFTAAQLGNDGFTAQAVQHNADFLLRRMRVARRMSLTNRSDGNAGFEDFWFIFTPSSLRWQPSAGQ
jgi:hypothetical protein